MFRSRRTPHLLLAAVLALGAFAAACTQPDRPTAPEPIAGARAGYTDDDGGDVCPRFDPFCQNLTAGEIAEIDQMLDRFTDFTNTECFNVYVKAKMALAGGFRLTKFTYIGTQVPGYSYLGGAYLVHSSNMSPMEISINGASLHGASPGETFKNFFHESHHAKKHQEYTNQFGSAASGYLALSLDGESPAENSSNGCYNPAG